MLTQQAGPHGFRRRARKSAHIGSGITEAACKTIVYGGGMRWHLDRMQKVLGLGALRRSSNRWDQFWQWLDQQGC